MDVDPYLAFVRELTRLSGDVILPYFANGNYGLELKADESPVTLADRRAEEVMRRRIRDRFPDHGVVGEEFGSERADAEFVWVLDPIDGTKSFITGVPLFTTLIGLLHRGRPLLGCIHQPVLQQTLIGDRKTTWFNERPVRMRNVGSLGEATLLITDPLLVERHQEAAGFEALARRARLYRTFGDGYGYLLVARGKADIMLDPVLNPWDLLPLIPVIEGAGGVITDWTGRPADEPAVNSCIACHPDRHAEVVAMLNGGVVQRPA